MSSQARLENVLRDIHVMISKSEVYDTDRIIVSKQDIFNLIDRLNASIYEIMDEYELTQQSRDRALREKKKEGDKIIWDASRQAEDIYAASVLYTEEALNHLNVMVDEADATVDRMYKEFRRNIKQQQETIRENQLELKSQLQLLADTEKYLRLIEERNREIERERAEKKGRKTLETFGEKHAMIKPEIKINEEYFRKAGIPFEKEEDKPAADEEFMEPLEDEGVIESTLKKAAEDIQQIFSEEKNPHKDGKQQDEEESSKKHQKEYDREEMSQTEHSMKEQPDHAAGGRLQSEAGDQSQAEYARGDQFSTEGDGKQQEAHQDDSDGKEYAEIQSAGTHQSQNIHNGTDKESTAEESEIKVNLEAEYFKQKNGESDEDSKQQHHEKLSLLDKLMGKKKTLL